MSTVDTTEILTKASRELKQMLEPNSVVDYLLSEGVLCQSEFDRCRQPHCQSREDQCEELINILKQKGHSGYQHFCTILSRTQTHLKSLLDITAKSGGITDSATQAEAKSCVPLHVLQQLEDIKQQLTKQDERNKYLMSMLTDDVSVFTGLLEWREKFVPLIVKSVVVIVTVVIIYSIHHIFMNNFGINYGCSSQLYRLHQEALQKYTICSHDRTDKCEQTAEYKASDQDINMIFEELKRLRTTVVKQTETLEQTQMMMEKTVEKMMEDTGKMKTLLDSNRNQHTSGWFSWITDKISDKISHLKNVLKSN